MGIKELFTKEIKMKSNKKTSYLSFEFSDYDIRIVKGVYHNNRLSVQNTYVIFFDEEIYNNGKILEYDAILDGISNEIKNQGINVKDAIFTINTTEAIVRTIEVPKITDEQDQINAIEYAIQDSFPGDMTDNIIEYRITEDTSTTCKVFACSIPKLLIDEKKRLFKDIGLKLRYIDINTNVLSKLLRFTIETSSHIDGYAREEKDEPTIAIVDFSSAVINVNIYTSGYLEFQRTSTTNFYQKHRNLFYVSEIDENIELVDIDENPDLKNDFTELADDIEKNFKYFTSRGLGNAIDEIYIQGYDFALKDYEKLFSERFSTPVFKMEKLNDIVDTDISLSLYLNAIGGLIRLD